MTGTSWADLMKNAKIASQPVTEGEHPVRITDAQAVQASTGKPMIKITAEILEGPDAKRKVYGQQVLSEDNGMALAIFFRTMEAIGLDDAFFSHEPSMGQVASNLIGRQARVVIKHREWNGATRSEIDRWLPSLGGGLAGGPIAPGTVVGPAGPPLPTANSSLPTQPATPTVPTSQPGPVAPTDAPPALPI